MPVYVKTTPVGPLRPGARIANETIAQRITAFVRDWPGDDPQRWAYLESEIRLALDAAAPR